MHNLLRESIIASVRRRAEQGDCPIEPRVSIANLEYALLDTADDLQKALTPSLPLADREAIAREGPAPITSDSLHCFGCVHLKTEDWREPSGDGETFDSGTSARCGKVPTEHGGQSISAYWNRQRSVPKWCPCLSLPPSPVGEGITTPAPVRGE